MKTIATTWVRFAISYEDRARLDDLVDLFGWANRSAYLRATLTIMEWIRRAETLSDLQARSHQRLAGRLPQFGMYLVDRILTDDVG